VSNSGPQGAFIITQSNLSHILSFFTEKNYYQETMFCLCIWSDVSRDLIASFLDEETQEEPSDGETINSSDSYETLESGEESSSDLRPSRHEGASGRLSRVFTKVRVFPDAQICAFWRMFTTNDTQNELILRHTGCTQCLSKWIKLQPYFVVFNNI